MTTNSDTDESRLREALAVFRAGEGPQIERWRTALVMAFYAGDLAAAAQILRDASDGVSAVSVLEDVLAPAMHYIGALWERNQLTVADEHLATAISHRLLAEVAVALQFAPPNTRETVLLATATPERHTTGLMMANDVLYGAGFNTIMLGAGVPDSALRVALGRHQPAVVALSATMQFPDALTATAKMVRSTAPSAHLIIGGAVPPSLPPAISALHVRRLSHLLETIENLVRVEGSVGTV